MGKILILSNSYPNYGGQSTTAYNLLKLLKEHGLDVKLLYINDLKHSEIDPEKTGSSHKIVMRKSIIHRIYRWQRKNKGIALDKQISIARNYYFLLRLLPQLLYFLFSKQFSPKLIITNIPSYYWLLRKVFGSRKILIIIGSSPEMNKLAKHKIDASSVIAGSPESLKILNNLYKPDYSNAVVLFNSQLTRQIYDTLHINTGDAIVHYFNLTPAKIEMKPDFDSRIYDIAFIASDFNRDIKNIPLARAIFSALSTEKKIAVGKGSSDFAAIKNTEVRNLSKQAEIIHLFSQTKLVIIPSYFDSSPSILSEAILSGCNVLVSKNVGWHETLDAASVIDNFYDEQEWISKSQHLLNTKVTHPAFESIIAGSAGNIVQSIESILNG